MSFASYSVRRPLAVVLAVGALALFGLISIGRLPLLFLPETSFPSLTIVANYADSSPREIERLLAAPLEGAIAGTTGIDSLSSSSSASNARIQASFATGTDMGLAAAEVRDRLDRVRPQLPADVGAITVRNFSTSDLPIMQFSVSLPGAAAQLGTLAEETVTPRLLRLDGVADVEIRGLRGQQATIELDPDALTALGVAPADVTSALRANNVNIAGGYLLDGGRRYFVRTTGEFTALEQIANLPVTGGFGGATVRIEDVANVSLTTTGTDSVQRLNMVEALTMRVFKTSTANVVVAAAEVRDALAELETEVPGLQTFIFSDQSEEIVTSLSALRDSGLIGAGLAVLVLLAFLWSVRSTLVVAVAIPISAVATFTVVFLMREVGGLNFTLNIISLSGLMLAVGMLVDNSVVVLENIHRHRELGSSPRAAASRGAAEVSVPVVAATVTSVIVFVPIVFMQTSTFGAFMSDFAATMVAATVASLLVSLTLIPVLASRVLPMLQVAPGGVGVPTAHDGSHRAMRWLKRRYATVLRWTLGHRLITVAGMLATLAGGFFLTTQIEREFIPRTPARRVSVSIRGENDATLVDTRNVFNEFEQSLLFRAGELELSAVSANFNSRGGSVTLYLRDDEATRLSTTEITDEVRGAFPQLAGYSFSVGRRFGRGGGGALGVSVDITGPDTEVLALFADDIGQRIASMSGVEDVSTNLESGAEQLLVGVDRDRASTLDVTAAQLSQTIRSSLSSSRVGTLRTGGQDLPISVEVREAERVDVSALGQLAVATGGGGGSSASSEAVASVPLATVADLERQVGPRSIQRSDGNEIVSVSASTDRSGLFRLQAELQEQLQTVELPAGYSANVGRSFRQFRESESASLFAVLLAAGFIYLVMAALFESFIHPITILMSLPFSVLGVAVLFYLTGTTLNTNSWLGIMVLFGVVVNNGIILVDRINRLRRQGVERTEAIFSAGNDRLRPILITAGTTLLGLSPMIAPVLFPGTFGPIEGRASLWAPIAMALVGGLTTSTFMTLVVMPTIYSLFDDLTAFLGKVLRFARRTSTSVGAHLEGGEGSYAD
jgi:HAE1 family hydrophobic/amphiphilic exporter-1